MLNVISWTEEVVVDGQKPQHSLEKELVDLKETGRTKVWKMIG